MKYRIKNIGADDFEVSLPKDDSEFSKECAKAIEQLDKIIYEDDLDKYSEERKYHYLEPLRVINEWKEKTLMKNDIKEVLLTEEQMEEFMILGLRMMRGISRAEFQKRFGKPIETVYGSALKKLERQGLLVLEGDTIALTDSGIDVSNQVLAEFLFDSED